MSDTDDGSHVPLMSMRDNSPDNTVPLSPSSVLSDGQQPSPLRTRRSQVFPEDKMTLNISDKEFHVDMQSSSISIDIRLNEPSNILNGTQIRQIARWVDQFKRPNSMELRYSLVRDGASMTSLLSQCRSKRSRSGAELTESYVLVVEDSMGYIFGAYIAHGIESHSNYYGSGENFVFQISPTPQVYRWTRENNWFFISDHNHLAIGGGGDGFAFQLDEDLDTGVSNRSATYNNNQLSSGEFFRVLNVEIFSMGEFLSI